MRLVLSAEPQDRSSTEPKWAIAGYAETVCFLAGPSAGYITGETVNIAGGIGV